MTSTPTASARERILDAAERRYYADGIASASADKLLADAGVSKVTFYRHFPTKDDLVVAYLERAAEAERQHVDASRVADDPAAVLRWYARNLADLSCSPGFRGCRWINAAAELADPGHPGRRVVAAHRAWLIEQAAEALRAMGVSEPEARAHRLMMLRDGALVAGYVDRDPAEVEADLLAAARAVITA